MTAKEQIIIGMAYECDAFEHFQSMPTSKKIEVSYHISSMLRVYSIETTVVEVFEVLYKHTKA